MKIYLIQGYYINQYRNENYLIQLIVCRVNKCNILFVIHINYCLITATLRNYYLNSGSTSRDVITFTYDERDRSFVENDSVSNRNNDTSCTFLHKINGVSVGCEAATNFTLRGNNPCLSRFRYRGREGGRSGWG